MPTKRTKWTKSKYYQEYMRQRRRVQSAIYRARKKGYDVPSLAPIPNQLRQRDVQRLSKITGESIRQKASFRPPQSQATKHPTSQLSVPEIHGPLYDEYMRERRRAQQAVRRAKKNGLDVPEIPEYKKIPTQADIDELKGITPEGIRVANRMKKWQDRSIPEESYMVLDRVYQIINNAFYDSSTQKRLVRYYANRLTDFLNNAIEQFGRDAVAKFLKNHPQAEQLTQEILTYKSSVKLFEFYYNRWINLIMSIGTENVENNPVEDISEDYWEEDE